MKSLPINEIVEKVTEKIYEQEPSLLQKFGERGKQKCIEDNHYHMKYLHTSYLLQNETVFSDYALWLNSLLTSRGMKTKHIIDNFILIEEALLDLAGDVDEPAKSYLSYLQAANEVLQGAEKNDSITDEK
ncbi:hypothetical protein [Bacillus sp. CBEL-1]|uniref:hypothetical protein n=1 Tax=Bacillus sp. CBEL-1 TaxID=2502980 RepID=UPI00104729C0|nr:hypothetical protein [Bacillus sp. CBEL-1]TDB50190.1 hypothetical protein EPL02_14070 [Bacillus sp. CBEL-1]USY53862.1 hypothetical protein NIZ91_14000 [Bacillus sp. 1780r2a1]